jgi:nitronate monooxygenase
MEGDCENGLVFAGARVHEINEILPVQTIIHNIMNEYKACI